VDIKLPYSVMMLVFQKKGVVFILGKMTLQGYVDEVVQGFHFLIRKTGQKGLQTGVVGEFLEEKGKGFFIRATIKTKGTNAFVGFNVCVRMAFFCHENSSGVKGSIKIRRLHPKETVLWNITIRKSIGQMYHSLFERQGRKVYGRARMLSEYPEP
jgi:hypothetical protein